MADPLPSLSTDQVLALAEVARQGNLRRAAEVLHISEQGVRNRLLALEQRLGIEPPPVAEDDTVETAVADLQVALPATLAAFQRAPGDAPARERLAVDLTTLKDDAKLLGDTRLEQDADAALAELSQAGMDGDTAALQEAVAAISATRLAAPAPAPSEETIRLLETDASQFDAELLDIYLTEADEVLDAIAASAVELKTRQDNRAALTTVRRSFHTLKGSGRMVGLNELGDLAFEVEKEHNRVLEDDRPVTPALLALIDVALQSFREWVDTLRRTGRVNPDTAPLRAALAQVGSLSSAQASPAASEPSPTPPVPERDLSPAVVPALALAARAPPDVSMIEVIEQDDTALPEIDRPDGDSTPVAQSAEIIEFKPIGTLHATAAIPAASESLPVLSRYTCALRAQATGDDRHGGYQRHSGSG
jgi:chemosensory pili system protein ChpA (sensor histidine kinase/response regulator)